ncbi:hypothetical protein LB505_013556 [Fusarium chuoi]|nr:hypothetical protein LB505_013556 [Fusarium chuoi]
MASVALSTPVKSHKGLFSARTAGGRMPLTPSPRQHLATSLGRPGALHMAATSCLTSLDLLQSPLTVTPRSPTSPVVFRLPGRLLSLVSLILPSLALATPPRPLQAQSPRRASAPRLLRLL